MESPDGKWFYFVRGANRSVWRMPVGGGSEEDAELVLESTHEGSYEVVEDGSILSLHRRGRTFRFSSSALPRTPSSRSMISRECRRATLASPPTADRFSSANRSRWRPTSCWPKISGEGGGGGGSG